MAQTPPADAALALFRVVQESLTNVAKYAHARHVAVALIEENGAVGVSVTDDGVGIAPEILAHPTSHGLTGMQQRVAPFGGTFEIRSDPGKGTRVSARVPLQRDTPASTIPPITTDVTV
jgi:signal transduction histidine kinase